MKKYKLELIVFLSGAIEMGLELLASRILSPYVGSSNVVWTSIIGIILASMSLGYWYGGKKAEENAGKDKLAEILLEATFFTSLIPLFETLFVKRIAGLSNNLIFSAIICAISVFSIPSFLLAMVSPIAVKIKTEKTADVGTSSGGISALSTLGSIIGTFFMGFVLIPHIGVSNINIGITLILTIMSIIIRENRDKKYFYLVVFIVSLSAICIITGKYIFKKSNPDIILDTDSQYSRIWVTNVKNQNGNYKTLQVDMGLESYLDTNSNEMGAEYLKFYDLFDYYNKNAKNTLLIGGAAYTYPMHYLNKYSDKNIDVVEIDDKMTKIADEEFGLNLNDDGLVITNIISGIEGNEADFLKYEYATYKAVFDDVKVFKVKEIRTPEETQNLILVGIKGNPNIDDERKNEYSYLLDRELTGIESDKKIVTDDFAPIGN